MTVLNRYVVRRSALPFAVTLGVVLFVLVLERLLEVIRLVADAGASIWSALEIMLYLLPHYLGLALPAATFLGVLLGLRRMRHDSELVALHAAGIPLTRTIQPLAAMAVLLALLVAINAAFVQPYARHAYRSLKTEVATSPFGLRLQAGVFHEVGNGMVLRADRVVQGGARLMGVFAADDRPQGRTFAVARSGRVSLDESGRNLVLRLSNGSLIRERVNGPAERISFGRYVWQLPVETQAGHGPRGQDERELTLPELAVGGAGLVPPQITQAQMTAELNARLIAAVSVPLLALMAAAFTTLGAWGRGQRATGFVSAIAALVMYQKLLAFAEGLVAQGEVSPLLAQWGVVFATAAATGVMLYIASEGRRRSGLKAPAQLPRPAAYGSEP